MDTACHMVIVKSSNAFCAKSIDLCKFCLNSIIHEIGQYIYTRMFQIKITLDGEFGGCE